MIVIASIPGRLLENTLRHMLHRPKIAVGIVTLHLVPRRSASPQKLTGVNFTAAAKVFSVMLSWSASTSTVTGYNVYRSTTSGSGYTKLDSSLITGTTYDDTTVQTGNTYFYVTTSVDSGGDESAFSNQATATIP